MTKVSILSAVQIELKIKRMAYEIWEQNSDSKEIILIGIKEVGFIVAQKIKDILQEISPLKTILLPLNVDKKSPLKNKDLKIDLDLNKKVIILIDDVANSGKTLMYALKPILDYVPKKIQIAILVDRKHKSYPIKPDIIGHSVSTTLQEHIIVSNEEGNLTGAHLE